ncbi:MAG TPA: peptidase M16 [Desulfobulbaceae bacterium]|nr:peptidase M16 [Desulfobulbaceae bacterium]
MTDFTPSSTYHGFTLKKKEFIREISSTVYLFEHHILGTPALAIKNDDPNKTFCVAFQTVPEDSTGVAHILEHSVLMGSKKYPVRDVFGEINKGGLMTFLNAMTGSDTTWYPFATRNTTEYFNILDVYCDVTLHPLLERSTFEQEGWHYHRESLEQPLQYQGVVYNEMKGAFSDPFRHLFHNTIKALMPGSTYAFESGGDPAVIPELSYEEFVAFHQTHYHPSNATLFFYGDADLNDELAYVQDNFLSRYDAPGDKAQIVTGNAIAGPIFIEESYAVGPESGVEGKTFLAVGSLTGNVLDRKRNTALRIIANILYNSDASPLKNAVIQAGLCRDFGGFFVTSSSFKTFMLTYLIGCDEEKRDRFLAVYTKTLQSMAEEGLDHDLVLSELNKYEFSVREEMNKAQRGLDLINKALPAMKYGADPFEALQIEQLFAEIRKDALEDNYFEKLIKQVLLDNNESVVVTLKPDPKKMEETLRTEQQQIAAYEQKLGTNGMEQLIEHTRELLNMQTTANDEQTLALLPSLTIEDLDPKPNFFQAVPDTVDDIPLIVSELDTNSISYIDVGFDCSGLPAESLIYLDLFGTIVTEIGTKDMDYRQFAKQINICTGGFSHSFSTYTQQNKPDSLRPVLWFQVKALSTYLDDALALVRNVLREVDFNDQSRIRDIVQREFAWSEHSVQSEGYSLASIRVLSHLSLAGKYNEQVTGATSYLALKKLAADYDELEEQFLQTLQSLKEHLLVKKYLITSITSRHEDIFRFKKQLTTLLPSPVDDLPVPVTPQFPQHPAKQAFCTSAEVVYNVQGCKLFPDPDAYNGGFEVLKTWLSRDYLWNSVRQIGGAYGCFIQFNQRTGNLAMVSYRDPQIVRTFAAYDDAWHQVQDIDLPASVLRQLIIGTYGNFDPHQGPATLGATARNECLLGITSSFKRQRVREILAATVADLKSFAPYLRNLAENKYIATIGNGAKIREHTEIYEDVMEL